MELDRTQTNMKEMKKCKRENHERFHGSFFQNWIS